MVLPSTPGLAMAPVLLLTGGDGCIAQLVEQLTLNQRAVGSSPTAPTNFSTLFADTDIEFVSTVSGAREAQGDA
jgi:hypothetical protein